MGKFCRKCGKEIRAGAQFCRNCGEKVRAANVQVQGQMPVSRSGPWMTSASGPVSAPGMQPQMNMTMQMQQQINANRQAAPAVTKDRDPYGAFRFFLVLACLALIVTGFILIPKNIRAAKAGRISTEGLITTINGEANVAGAVLEKGDRALTDEQKAAYAAINERQNNYTDSEEDAIESMHDCSSRYDDEDGWVEVKEDEE